MKDGKIGRKDGQPLPGEDEPLHAYVTANNPENVTKAVDKVCVYAFLFLLRILLGIAHVHRIVPWKMYLEYSLPLLITVV